MLADASIHLYHVRLSYVIKGFTYLLTYLDALCEHTMQQTTTRPGLCHQPRWRSLQRSPDLLPCFGGRFAAMSGRGKGRGPRREDEEWRLTLMRSWNRVADWLRTTMSLFCNISRPLITLRPCWRGRWESLCGYGSILFGSVVLFGRTSVLFGIVILSRSGTYNVVQSS